MKKLTCAEAKEIDLVDYLACLGFQPQKVRNSDYWYLSPFRDERTPSFKVNRQKNIWYDHGQGNGGDLIDFGTLYFSCSISELLARLPQQITSSPFSFHRQPTGGDRRTLPASFAGEKKDNSEGKIAIVDSRPLTDESLLNYLKERNVPLEIASRFCKEVDFSLYNRRYTVIGFPNGSGGYELRGPSFKGSSSPKGITFIDNQARQVAVFEGFFSFLSFLTIHKCKGLAPINYLILNSIGFFEQSRPVMEKHTGITLLLDRDKVGMKCAQQALNTSPLYKDGSIHYPDHKDLNAYLVAHRDGPQLDLSPLFREGLNITKVNVPDESINLPTKRGRRM